MEINNPTDIGKFWDNMQVAFKRIAERLVDGGKNLVKEKNK